MCSLCTHININFELIWLLPVQHWLNMEIRCQSENWRFPSPPSRHDKKYFTYVNHSRVILHKDTIFRFFIMLPRSDVIYSVYLLLRIRLDGTLYIFQQGSHGVLYILAFSLLPIKDYSFFIWFRGWDSIFMHIYVAGYISPPNERWENIYCHSFIGGGFMNARRVKVCSQEMSGS